MRMRVKCCTKLPWPICQQRNEFISDAKAVYALQYIDKSMSSFSRPPYIRRPDTVRTLPTSVEKEKENETDCVD